MGHELTDQEIESRLGSGEQTDDPADVLSRDIFDEFEKIHLDDEPYIFVPGLLKDALQQIVVEP